MHPSNVTLFSAISPHTTAPFLFVLLPVSVMYCAVIVRVTIAADVKEMRGDSVRSCSCEESDGRNVTVLSVRLPPVALKMLWVSVSLFKR